MTGLRRWRRHRCGDADRGAATAELLVMFPVVVALFAFGLLIVRGVTAGIDVGDAASAGARAASLQRGPAAAIAAARTAVRSDITTHDTACTHLTVSVDISAFRPGGTVTVRVSCTVNLADLPMPGLGRRIVTATSTSPIDLYRQDNR